MASLDDVSLSIGRLLEGTEGLKRTVDGIDMKVDGLGMRMIVVEQFKERFTTLEATVKSHENLIQRGTGVYMLLAIVCPILVSLAVDVVKRFLA